MYKMVYSGRCANEDDYPWPEEPPTFRDSVVRYYEFCYQLTQQLAMAHGAHTRHAPMG